MTYMNWTIRTAAGNLPLLETFPPKSHRHSKFAPAKIIETAIATPNAQIDRQGEKVRVRVSPSNGPPRCILRTDATERGTSPERTVRGNPMSRTSGQHTMSVHLALDNA